MLNDDDEILLFLNLIALDSIDSEG